MKMRLTLLLCSLFIQIWSIDHVDSQVPPAVKDTYHHPNNISFQLFCPETPVEAVAGHPVILKCYTKPELKVEKVEWLVNGSDEVHLFRKGKDSYVSQNEKYKGKTSLFKDELYRGNSSLNLTADMSHSGNYCCLVSARKVHRDCYITVNVHPEEEEDSSQKHRDVTVSPVKLNNGTDGQNNIIGGVVGGVLGVGALIIIALAYRHRKRCTQQHSQGNSNNSRNDQDVPLQAQQPLQNQGNEPVAQNPNEEGKQMLGNEDQDDPADGNEPAADN